ncbi:MAG: GNAT family N-acetyltransferase [SAR324 cluster bacterium]|nr:GNAT family N-acetyltransferase [SAR324 cluster bacterium]
MQFTIRGITADDSQRIVEIDAFYSDEAKPEYWEERLNIFKDASDPKSPTRGFAVVADRKVVGYIIAESRAWEFGSPPCGWIFAVGVDPQYRRYGVALTLCREVCREFKASGIRHVRTMVRRDNVDILSFFRASGFRAGPFIELELEL